MTEEKNSEKPFTVKCPTCGKEVVWSTDNPYRPFCSERCRMIDLGEWASGGYRIEGAPEARISSIRVTLLLKSRTPAKAGETVKTQATRPELRTLPRQPLQTLIQPEDTPGFRALRQAL